MEVKEVFLESGARILIEAARSHACLFPRKHNDQPKLFRIFFSNLSYDITEANARSVFRLNR
jgi:hypothetical protein